MGYGHPSYDGSPYDPMNERMNPYYCKGLMTIPQFAQSSQVLTMQYHTTCEKMWKVRWN